MTSGYPIIDPPKRGASRRAASALALAGVVGLLLSPQRVAAVGRQAGQISGAVYDQQGVGLPQVTVRVTGPALIGGPREVKSDKAGNYRLIELPPGVYAVTTRRAGMKTVTQSGVRVRLGTTTPLHLVMTVPTAKQTHVVRYERPVVDPERVGTGVHVDREFAEDLPLEREVTEIVQMAPGVTKQFATVLPNIRGGSLYDNVLLVDGVNMNDPFLNTFGTLLNFDAIVEVQVLTGGLDAEYGQALGGIVNLVTAQGGNAFKVDASVYGTHSTLAAAQTAGQQDSEENRAEGNLNFGGPIVRDKLWYFVSNNYRFEKETLASEPASGLPPHPSYVVHQYRGMAKLTYSPRPEHRLQLIGLWEPSWGDNILRDPTMLPAGTIAETGEPRKTAELAGNDSRLFTTLAWSYAILPELLLETRGSFGLITLEQTPQSGDFDTPSHLDTDTGLRSANAREYLRTDRYRAGLDASLSYFGKLGGDHEVKLGVQYAPTWQTTETGAPGDAIFLDQGSFCDPTRGATAGCSQLVRIGDQDPASGDLIAGAFSTSTSSQTVGLYLQDRYQPWKWLTLRLGWRVDISQSFDEDGQVVMDQLGWFGPRAGLAWDLLKDSTTVFRAFYGRYHNTGFLVVPQMVGRTQRRETYNYTAATNDFDRFSFATGGAASGIRDPEMSKDPPRTDEVVVGIQRQLGRKASVDLAFTYRHEQNLFRGDEVNIVWNQLGDSFSGFRDQTPGARYFLVTPDEAFRRYLGLDLTFQAKPHERMQLLASYTWSKLEGTLETDVIRDLDRVVEVLIDNPRQDPYLFGPLSSDRRHQLKLFGSYTLRRPKITLGVAFNFASGIPYDKLYFNRVLGAYVDRRAPRGRDPGDINDPNDDRDLRLPDLFSLDLRLKWHLEPIIGQRLEAIADVRNVLNLQTPIAVEQRDVPTFGEALARQPPFRLTLGLRYRW